MEEYSKEIYKEAQAIGQCGMLTGEENVEQLCALIFTAQGIEYITSHSFPSLKMFRKIAKKHDISLYHVFVDKGRVSFVNERKIALVGDTTAEIICDKTRAYHIHLMHGAKAKISASGYAVVKIEKDERSMVEYTIKDNAKILL